MTNIIYDSRTGQVERFVERLKQQTSWHFYKLSDCSDMVEKFHLLTYTDGFGETPATTEKFLASFGHQILSVGASGNKNWGEHQFAKAADNIAQRYNIPQSLKFELSGSQKAVLSFINFIENYE